MGGSFHFFILKAFLGLSLIFPTIPFISVSHLYAQVETCNDNLKNGDETDVDCGGSCEAGCGPGKECIEDSDCQETVTQPINPFNESSEIKTYSGITCRDTFGGKPLPKRQCGNDEIFQDFLRGYAAVELWAEATAVKGDVGDPCEADADCKQGLACFAKIFGVPQNPNICMKTWPSGTGGSATGTFGTGPSGTGEKLGCMDVCTSSSECEQGLECAAPTWGIPYRHCYAEEPCAAQSRYATPSGNCDQPWHTGERNNIGGCVSRPVTKLELSVQVGFQDDAGIKDTSYTDDFRGQFHDDDIIFETCSKDRHMLFETETKCFRTEFSAGGDVPLMGHKTFTIDGEGAYGAKLSDLTFPHHFKYFRIESDNSQDKWFLQGLEMKAFFQPLEGKPESVVYYRNPVVNRWIKKQDGKNWFSPHNIEKDQAMACFVYTPDLKEAGTDGEVFMHFPLRQNDMTNSFKRWLEYYDYQPKFSGHRGVPQLSIRSVGKPHDEVVFFLNYENVDDFDRGEGNSYGFTAYATQDSLEPYFYISRGGSRSINDDLAINQVRCYTFKPGSRKFIDQQELRAGMYCLDDNSVQNLFDAQGEQFLSHADAKHAQDITLPSPEMGACASTEAHYLLTNRPDQDDPVVVREIMNHTWPAGRCSGPDALSDTDLCFNKALDKTEMAPIDQTMSIQSYNSIKWAPCQSYGFGWFSFDRAGACRF